MCRALEGGVWFGVLRCLFRYLSELVWLWGVDGLRCKAGLGSEYGGLPHDGREIGLGSGCVFYFGLP